MNVNTFCDICHDPEIICLEHLDIATEFPIIDFDPNESSSDILDEFCSLPSTDVQLSTFEYDQITSILCDMILMLSNNLNEVMNVTGFDMRSDLLDGTTTMIDFEASMIHSIIKNRNDPSARSLRDKLEGINYALNEFK